MFIMVFFTSRTNYCRYRAVRFQGWRDFWLPAKQLFIPSLYTHDVKRTTKCFKEKYFSRLKWFANKNSSKTIYLSSNLNIVVWVYFINVNIKLFTTQCGSWFNEKQTVNTINCNCISIFQLLLSLRAFKNLLC